MKNSTKDWALVQNAALAIKNQGFEVFNIQFLVYKNKLVSTKTKNNTILFQRFMITGLLPVWQRLINEKRTLSLAEPRQETLQIEDSEEAKKALVLKA